MIGMDAAEAGFCVAKPRLPLPKSAIFAMMLCMNTDAAQIAARKARKAEKAAALRSRSERKAAAQADHTPRTTLSFYRYVQIADPVAFRKMLLRGWGELGCFGRIYVAHEGINAQMNVPSEHFAAFQAFNSSVPELQDVPYKIAVAEGRQPSFYKLTIKVRKKIVADGLDDSTFDVTNTGAYLTAKEMNEYVEDPEAVVIDMRNAYESEVGHFENAYTPDVDSFREELKMLPETLRVHKNKKIALYCTGGIRCEKASAWLKHNGFSDVRHLKGGIIDYAHQVKKEGLPNKFKGSNFVFDERLGERIGDEIISTCHLCDTTKSDTHYHCAFQPCHRLYLACDACQVKYKGYCSRTCQVIDKLPANLKLRYNRWLRKQNPAQFRKRVGKR